MLIIDGATAGVSVVQLYAGAMLPGFMLASLYIVYVIGRAFLNPSLAPKPSKEDTDMSFVEIMKMLLTSFFPLAMLILSVLGVILFGLATPTERSENTSELQAQMRISYAVFCLNKKRLRSIVMTHSYHQELA